MHLYEVGLPSRNHLTTPLFGGLGVGSGTIEKMVLKINDKQEDSLTGFLKPICTGQ